MRACSPPPTIPMGQLVSALNWRIYYLFKVFLFCVLVYATGHQIGFVVETKALFGRRSLRSLAAFGGHLVEFGDRTGFKKVRVVLKGPPLPFVFIPLLPSLYIL